MAVLAAADLGDIIGVFRCTRLVRPPPPMVKRRSLPADVFRDPGTRDVAAHPDACGAGVGVFARAAFVVSAVRSRPRQNPHTAGEATFRQVQVPHTCTRRRTGVDDTPAAGARYVPAHW